MDKLSEEAGTVALDTYLRALVDELIPGPSGSRSVLVNVDDLRVPAHVAEAIGEIVRDLVVNGLAKAIGGDPAIVEIACGTNPDGSITLAISEERGDAGVASGQAVQQAGPTLVSKLVSELGAGMAVEATERGLRCTIVVPAHAV